MLKMWQLIGGSLATGGSHGTTGIVVNPALATPMCGGLGAFGASNPHPTLSRAFWIRP